MKHPLTGRQLKFHEALQYRWGQFTLWPDLRLKALTHGAFKCFLINHDWDLAVHGPSGSGFVCTRCKAKYDSESAYRKPDIQDAK